MADDLVAQPPLEANRPEHGTKAANERALAAVPLGGQPMPVPGARGPLTRPTDRPREPVQAGLSTGPGPGPSQGLNTLDTVKAIYRAHPSEGLRRMVEHLQRKGL